MGDLSGQFDSSQSRDAITTVKDIKSVAVIGAGVSGILSARYLKEAGLDVAVFERNDSAGGVWIYSEKPGPEPSYPATDPLETAIQLCPWSSDQPRPPETLNAAEHSAWINSHAPPGPCYPGLTTNFSVLAMELKDHPWPWDIPIPTAEQPDHASEWPGHEVVLSHLRSAVSKFDLKDKIRHQTLVEKVDKLANGQWSVRTSTMTPSPDADTFDVKTTVDTFDAVVVASGHYNTPRVADIPGLKAWRERFPERVMHSMSYRHPEDFKDQTVLLVAGGTSSTEIAREISHYTSKIYQSGRGTVFDLPLDLLPESCQRVGEIASFDVSDTLASNISGIDTSSKSILGTVTLRDGTVLHDIDRVIVCTGYHYSYPFLSDLHRPSTGNFSEERLRPLTSNGSCILNLHQDIFYIPDPTLCFAGISTHISTFAFFEYQTMAVASFLSGKANLPSRAEMEETYKARVETRGETRMLNARMDEEVAYVDKIIAWLNETNEGSKIEGFSAKWHAVRDAGKLAKVRLRFAREKAEREAQGGTKTET